MRWPLVCDATYSAIGAIIVLGVWLNHGADRGVQIGLLLAASYIAGGMKYQHPTRSVSSGRPRAPDA